MGEHRTRSLVGVVGLLFLRWVLFLFLIMSGIRAAMQHVIIMHQRGVDFSFLHYGILAAVALAGIGLPLLEVVRPRMAVRATLAILCCLTLLSFLGWLRIDTVRPARIFSEKDVALTSPDAVESAERLALLCTEGELATRYRTRLVVPFEARTGWTTSNFVSHASEIDAAWTHSGEVRQLIARLDRFDVISDLPPGVPIMPGQSRCVSLLLYGSLAQLYRARGVVEAFRGDADEALRELATFHRVTCKLHASCCYQVNRAISVAIIKLNMEALVAVLVERDGVCGAPTMEILRSSFSPISDQDLDLTRMVITEHVGRQNLTAALAEVQSGRRDVSYRGDPAILEWILADAPWIGRAGLWLPNETLETAQRYTRDLLEALPDAVQCAQIERSFFERQKAPLFRNLGGGVMLMGLPQVSRLLDYSRQNQDRSLELARVLAVDSPPQRRAALQVLAERWEMK